MSACIVCGYRQCRCHTHCPRCNQPNNRCQCEQQIHGERRPPWMFDDPEDDEDMLHHKQEAQQDQAYWHGWAAAKGGYTKLPNYNPPTHYTQSQLRNFWRGVSDARHALNRY